MQVSAIKILKDLCLCSISTDSTQIAAASSDVSLESYWIKYLDCGSII